MTPPFQARKVWDPISPLPPFEAGRTQGACTASSMVLISGGDGGNIGARVLRLTRSGGGGQWVWDAALPPLPPSAARFTAAAHAIGGDRWLVIGLGTGVSRGSVMIPYRLDLQSSSPRWEAIPPYPLASDFFFGKCTAISKFARRAGLPPSWAMCC